jgi:hypothetical protein
MEVEVKENLNIPTMLPIRECAKRFELSEHYLRMLVKRNPCPIRIVYAGKRCLVNANSLCAYLNGEDEAR